MTRLLLLFLAAFVGVTSSAAAAGSDTLPSLLERLAARFRNVPVVYAEFSQTKTLTTLTRPLHSSGRLVLARDRGVLWQVEKPYKVAFVIGEDRLSEVRADGSVRKRTLREVPAVGHVSRVFRAILSGNKEVLGEYFDLHLTGNTADWELRLIPRTKVSPYLKSIVVKGGEFIEQILLEEPSGDRTMIRFTSQRAESALSPDEQRLFDSE